MTLFFLILYDYRRHVNIDTVFKLGTLKIFDFLINYLLVCSTSLAQLVFHFMKKVKQSVQYFSFGQARCQLIVLFWSASISSGCQETCQLAAQR